MGHYAKVVDGIVTQVIVAEESFFETFMDTSPGQWIQTSYNTYGGKHLLGGVPLRKNFASEGYIYDASLDAFIPPQPFKSWTLNKETCLWEAPVEMPENSNALLWDEENQIWKTIEQAKESA